MQQSALQIRDRLLSGLDNDYNVVNMGVVVEVLAQLENFQITKETLETTRLGKYINELRRKTKDRHLASRAKSLVKSWRQLVVTASTATNSSTTSQVTTTTSATASSLKNNKNGNSNSNDHQNSNNFPKNNGSHRVSPPIIPSGASTSVATTATSVANNRNHHHKSNNNNRTSSLPSSASTSPGLSQPTTPSRPVSPYNDTTGVSKTNAANKRLRKEESVTDEQNENEEPPAKRAHLTNGHINAEILLDGDTRDSVISASSNTCDNSLQSTQKLRNQNQTPGAITPARRKTRSSTKTSAAGQETDVLEQQMLSVRKAAGKVRTTQEIVQELALRSQSPGSAAFVTRNSVVTNDGGGFEVNETKVELMNRFFESQDGIPPGGTSNGLSPPLSRAPTPEEQTPLQSAVTSAGPSSPDYSTSVEPSRSATPFVNGPEAAAAASGKETAEEIMSRLPLIKATEVKSEWETVPDTEDGDEDDEEQEIDGLIPVMPKDRPEVTEEMVMKLHTTNVETINGNFDHKGEFREWHEVLTKETKDGDLLYVLPYSVIE